MLPQYKALHKKLMKQALNEAPQQKQCPKCRETKDVAKHFGFRTQHSLETGEPKRTMPQSYCRSCRKAKRATGSTH